MKKPIANTPKNKRRLLKLFTKKQLAVALLEAFELLIENGVVIQTKHIKTEIKR